MPLGTEVGHGTGHIMLLLDRDPAPPYIRGTASFFAVYGRRLTMADVHFGQTAQWIRMPLGTEAGLGSGNIVLDEDPARSNGKGHSSPRFLGPCLFCR